MQLTQNVKDGLDRLDQQNTYKVDNISNAGHITHIDTSASLHNTHHNMMDDEQFDDISVNETTSQKNMGPLLGPN